MIEQLLTGTSNMTYLAPLLPLFFLFAFSNGQAEPESIEEVAIKINKLVGDATATDASYCEMMPIGVKPAGGPWGFLVYSSENVDTEELTRLVERYNELDAARNEEEGLFSTGDVATEPELHLAGNRCRGVGLYAWNPGFILEFNEIEK